MNIVQEKRTHFKKSLPWKRISAAVAAVLLAVVTIFSALEASKMPAYAASKDLYFDKDGNLCFESRDTKRTSGIGYETVGYTFHQANTDSSINESGAYASMGFTGSKEPISNSDGTVTTVYYMDAANLQSAMNKVDPSGNWYNSFVNGDGTIYASAIMRTFTMTSGKKTPSGKSLTNGIVADDWYGFYAYSERSVSDDFTPSYNISYTVRSEYLDKWTDENGEEHEETKVSLYSYNGVIVSNDAYGKATYGNPYSLEWVQTHCPLSYAYVAKVVSWFE